MYEFTTGSSIGLFPRFDFLVGVLALMPVEGKEVDGIWGMGSLSRLFLDVLLLKLTFLFRIGFLTYGAVVTIILDELEF